MIHRLDTIARYQTPESVELSLSLAGPMVRGLAWLIDFSIRLVCYLFLGAGVAFLGGLGKAVLFVGLFIIEWFYPVLFEVFSGSTPGKRVLGIQVVHEDGTPVSWTASLIRNLLRPIDFLPLFNLTGFVTMVVNPHFKRLGDIAAGTLVVYCKELIHDFSIPEYPPAPPPVPFKLEEQRLILDFCERAGGLSTERRHELALILADITDKDPPENRLLTYGNWFLRGRAAHESKSV